MEGIMVEISLKTLEVPPAANSSWFYNQTLIELLN
jgi:hypothetical protein